MKGGLVLGSDNYKQVCHLYRTSDWTFKCPPGFGTILYSMEVSYTGCLASLVPGQWLPIVLPKHCDKQKHPHKIPKQLPRLGLLPLETAGFS